MIAADVQIVRVEIILSAPRPQGPSKHTGRVVELASHPRQAAQP